MSKKKKITMLLKELKDAIHTMHNQFTILIDNEDTSVKSKFLQACNRGLNCLKQLLQSTSKEMATSIVGLQDAIESMKNQFMQLINGENAKGRITEAFLKVHQQALTFLADLEKRAMRVKHKVQPVVTHGFDKFGKHVEQVGGNKLLRKVKRAIKPKGPNSNN